MISHVIFPEHSHFWVQHLEYSNNDPGLAFGIPGNRFPGISKVIPRVRAWVRVRARARACGSA
eukprot:5699324-Pyramimonas_sp.AAC.1